VTAIDVQHLGKRYGSLAALDDVSFTVPVGAIFGLVGPNGAGKTTTLSVLATLLLPTSGQVSVAGCDPITDPRAVRRVMGYMPDTLGVYDSLQVDEYLRFFCDAYNVQRSRWNDHIGDLLTLVDLDVKRTAMVNSLSRGMKQRLSLARALIHDPSVLILDEPASGLDPRARVDLRELIVGLREMGKTIIVSSHILPELQEMCTHVAIMEAGRLLASGSPHDILTDLGDGRRVQVRFSDGTTEDHVVAGTVEQTALLKRLVADDEREVVEFVQLGGDLEDLFLRITKGVVQ
jgi:ABC-2 type transport system ATP-binding protein